MKDADNIQSLEKQQQRLIGQNKIERERIAFTSPYETSEKFKMLQHTCSGTLPSNIFHSGM
jgi:hypothetical protein